MSRIEIVQAGAGTGKTHHIVERVHAAIVRDGLQASTLLATTFTVKAARELLERIRRSLLRQGRHGDANALVLARIGTVNAVTGALTAEFAFELGLSPRLVVLAEEAQPRFFRRAVGEVLADLAPDVHAAADRLGIGDLAGPVLRIVDLARSNGLRPEELPAQAEASLRGYRRLLEEPAEDGRALDAKLLQVIEEVREELRSRPALGQQSQRVLEALESPVLHDIERMRWAHWAKLSGLSPNAPERNLVAPVHRAARAHLRHPRLHRDLELVIRAIFDRAAEALRVYGRHKANFGLLDFVDQETLACRLLEDERVRRRLAEALNLVVVDEFQDTSPIQLDLFLRLARLRREDGGGPVSLWVGDPKQAIYGFRGTDPELVTVTAETLVRAPDGETESHTLAQCHRSRASLIAFFNDLFVPAFRAHGMDEEAVRLEAAREDHPAHGPALHLWDLRGSNLESAYAALAAGIRRLLHEEEWKVLGEEGPRTPLGSDVAVLCRKNDHCEKVAAALARAGLDVALERDGLLDTAEGAYGFAALRYLVDPGDTLALAEMIHLREGRGKDFPSWLDDWLARTGSEDGEGEVQGEGRCAPSVEMPEFARINRLRERLADLTPAEALDAALIASGAPELVCRWGDARRRLANLDALRGLARRYEEACREARAAATASGLVAWIRQEGGRQPANPDERAVRVLTYHRAKGLEWPIVVLTGLDEDIRGSPFGIHVEAAKSFDPNAPLAGRTIRYWPRPYGSGNQGGPILDKASDTEEAADVADRERREAVRLLYVGMTRARDYLVLAPRTRQNGNRRIAWLELLEGGGRALGSLPPGTPEPREHELGLAGGTHTVVVLRLDPPEGTEGLDGSHQPIFGPVFSSEDAGDAPVRPAYRVVPSAVAAGDGVRIEEEVRLGPRIPLASAADMERIGEALHVLFAADRPEEPEDERLRRAESIRRRWRVGDLDAGEMLEMARRFWTFVAARWPGGERLREWPLVGVLEDGRRLRGRVDLLVRTDDAVALVDHKTFPGRAEAWRERAREAAGQLGLYGRVVERETGIRPELWVHFPVVGRMVRIAVR